MVESLEGFEMIDTLTPREQRLLELRFGLKDGQPRTLEAVGKEFNVTRERIRQIQGKALRKLRHPSRHMRQYLKLVQAIFGESLKGYLNE